jgi:hypothetical protein
VGYLVSLHPLADASLRYAELDSGLGHGETHHLVSGTVTGLVMFGHGAVLPTVTPMLGTALIFALEALRAFLSASVPRSGT